MYLDLSVASWACNAFNCSSSVSGFCAFWSPATPPTVVPAWTRRNSCLAERGSGLAWLRPVAMSVPSTRSSSFVPVRKRAQIAAFEIRQLSHLVRRVWLWHRPADRKGNPTSAPSALTSLGILLREHRRYRGTNLLGHMGIGKVTLTVNPGSPGIVFPPSAGPASR